MNNNRPGSDARAKDELVIDRAVKRLKKAYLRHASWRGVARERGVNVRYVWALCQRGEVPRNTDVRAAVFLPHMMPSERNRKPKPPFVRIGEPGWEERYFRKLGKSR